MNRIGVILRIFVIACFVLLLWVGCASAATLVVNQTFPACVKGEFYCDTIQEAVDKANDGDTIIVCSGTYGENIKVNKSLTIQSENGSDSTIVRAEYPEDHVLNVTADYVNISGFTVEGAFEWGWWCAGIYLYHADYCNISNNNCYQNWGGINLEKSNNNSISNNNCKNFWYCINLYGSNSNSIFDNNCSHSVRGIELGYSNNNSIFNNNCSSNVDENIYLINSNNNSISNNNCSSTTEESIFLIDSNNNSISNNKCSNNTDAICMISSSNNAIRNNLLKLNDHDGISLSNCYKNTIEENIISDNEWFSVSLNNCSFNTIRNNTIKSNYKGISLSSSNNNTIRENTVSENTELGISLRESHDNIIKNNELKSNDRSGIELSHSNNNTIEKNTASDNRIGVELTWYSKNNKIKNNVLKSNRVDGISLYVSSDKNTIERNTVSHNFYGIHLDLRSVNNVIKNNIVNSNEYGILLTSNSNNNIIEGNIASDNNNGIDLSYSYHDIIRNNIIKSNDEYGINLYSSNFTLLENNNISINRHEGIYIGTSSIGNLIYHNNIIDNNFWGPFKGYQPQVEDYYYLGLTNKWFDPTLFEGNYWSDFLGADDGSGIGKHNINGDGIGDTNIPHPDSGNDYYPFINKSGWLTFLVSPEYWDFGTVYQGDVNPQQTFEIQNRGKEDLTISNMISDEDVEITGIKLPTTISAGRSKTFNVTIDIKNLKGDILRSIEIISNDKITPTKTILMYGFVKVPTHDVRIEKSEFESRVIKGQINLFRISVNNIGVANETNITVNFSDGNRLLDSQEIPELKKNESKTVKFKWDTANVSSGIHEIKIEVISDKGESLDSLEVKVYVLPHGVRIEKPEFETRVIKGQINLFRISVNNTGVANESNITVNFSEGDILLDSQEISELKKNETKTVKFKWGTSNASLGIHEIKIEVISDNGESLDKLEVKVYVLPTTKASTFIVTNLKRMVEKWRSDNLSELEEKLIELSFHPSVNGIIVRVENETNSSKMYKEWDEDTEPEKANEIAKTIKNLIDSKLGNYSNIEYLIIVGDDRIIPFYRIKDNTSESYIGPAGWWDEAEYAKDIDDKSTVGKALSLNYYLTDDFYADFEEEKLPIKLHMPDTPIGRLVETPEEIISTIDTFLTRYAVYPRKIFVTGCEFMSDGSSSAAEIWKGIKEPVFMVNSSTEVNYNSSEEIKEEILNGSNNITAIFLHADHSGFVIPPGKNVSDPQIKLAASKIYNSTRIEGAIVYAMSCHSGLNVPQEELNSLDLVQAFVKKGVIAYVAPTGYGMGGMVTVAGHEKLLNYFTEHLCEEKEVGESLISAKRDYYLNNFHMDYLDEKVISSTVLYGLPMYGVVAEKKREEEEKVMAEGTNLKDEIQGMRIEELEIYTLTLRPKLKPEDVSSESGKPILPMATWSYVAGKKKIHGITLKTANYTFTENVSRSIEFFAVSKIDLEWHNKRKNWYPSQFFKLNTIGEIQNMVIVTGQFNVTDPWSKNGTYLGDERLFKELTFDIYLSPSDAEEEKPIINDVERPKEGNGTSVKINATDNSGILKVIVTYTDKNSSNREWVSIEAEEDIQKPDEYYCELDGDVEFFVQAVDNYGNVAIDDYREKYYP